MGLQIVTATAPSAWASYLINGDSSGIDAEDVAAADRFVAEILGAWPVDCEDAGFRWNHDASGIMPLGADCQLYSALIEESAQ
jgi:hypothetical protein